MSFFPRGTESFGKVQETYFQAKNIVDQRASNRQEKQLDVVEFYSGLGRIASWGTKCGYNCATFGYKDNHIMEDALGIEGFLTLLRLTMSIREEGLAHWATVCSSWVFLCRDITGRASDRPLGWTEHESVRAGNTQVARMALVLMLQFVFGIHFIVEQPASSIMKAAPWMAHMRHMVKFWYTSLWMGMYGADTQKPTQLMSASFWSSFLGVRRDTTRDAEWSSTQLVSTGAPDHRGRLPITGAKDMVKQSQEYPWGYAKAVIEKWAENKNEPFTEDNWDWPEIQELDWTVHAKAQQDAGLDWTMAKLNDVADFLGIPKDRPMKRY